MLTERFVDLRNAIIRTTIFKNLPEERWKSIHGNPLSIEHPYHYEIKKNIIDILDDLLRHQNLIPSELIKQIELFNNQLTREILPKDLKSIDDLVEEETNTESKEIIKIKMGTAENRQYFLKKKDQDAEEDRLPLPKQILATTYQTDKTISARMKEEYNHECQICGIPTFETKNGFNYTESHHIIPIRKGGKDAPFNIIIVCPLCHSKIHYGSEIVKVELYKIAKEKEVITEFEELLANKMISKKVYKILTRTQQYS